MRIIRNRSKESQGVTFGRPLFSRVETYATLSGIANILLLISQTGCVPVNEVVQSQINDGQPIRRYDLTSGIPPDTRQALEDKYGAGVDSLYQFVAAETGTVDPELTHTKNKGLSFQTYNFDDGRSMVVFPNARDEYGPDSGKAYQYETHFTEDNERGLISFSYYYIDPATNKEVVFFQVDWVRPAGFQMDQIDVSQLGVPQRATLSNPNAEETISYLINQTNPSDQEIVDNLSGFDPIVLRVIGPIIWSDIPPTPGTPTLIPTEAPTAVPTEPTLVFNGSNETLSPFAQSYINENRAINNNPVEDKQFQKDYLRSWGDYFIRQGNPIEVRVATTEKNPDGSIIYEKIILTAENIGLIDFTDINTATDLVAYHGTVWGPKHIDDGLWQPLENMPWFLEQLYGNPVLPAYTDSQGDYHYGLFSYMNFTEEQIIKIMNTSDIEEAIKRWQEAVNNNNFTTVLFNGQEVKIHRQPFMNDGKYVILNYMELPGSEGKAFIIIPGVRDEATKSFIAQTPFLFIKDRMVIDENDAMGVASNISPDGIIPHRNIGDFLDYTMKGSIGPDGQPEIVGKDFPSLLGHVVTITPHTRVVDENGQFVAYGSEDIVDGIEVVGQMIDRGPAPELSSAIPTAPVTVTPPTPTP